MASWPAVSLQGCSSLSASQSARRKQRDFTPLHCIRRRAKRGQQHGKEVQGEEKNLNGVPWTLESPVCLCTIPAEHPCSSATRPCWMRAAASQHQTGTAGHPPRLPSGSPFPNLINKAALEALLHSVQVQKTPAGPRGGAQGVATLNTDARERVAAPAICSLRWKSALTGKRGERLRNQFASFPT